MTLTKDHLVDSLYTSLDLPKGKSASLVETLLEIMKNQLETKEDILISGFGKFCVKDKNDRRGRNPATGEDLILESRRVVVFKCSGILRKKINGKGETNLQR